MDNGYLFRPVTSMKASNYLVIYEKYSNFYENLQFTNNTDIINDIMNDILDRKENNGNNEDFIIDNC